MWLASEARKKTFDNAYRAPATGKDAAVPHSGEAAV